MGTEAASAAFRSEVEYMVLSTAAKNWQAIFHFYLDELGMEFWSARLFKRMYLVFLPSPILISTPFCTILFSTLAADEELVPVICSTSCLAISSFVERYARIISSGGLLCVLLRSSEIASVGCFVLAEC